MKRPYVAAITLALGFVLAAPLLLPAAAQAADRTAAASTALPVEIAPLLPPPQVPPMITRTHPARVVVRLETREARGVLADGVEYDFWTFNGTVPGPLIRVREGDTVEIHLRNAADSHMPHNIDLHAVMGPGGGAAVSMTPPGQETIFAFKAIHPGLFVYHCATPPVAMHVAQGMYGMILVQPRDGSLPRVDKEFYVMQGEFYTGAPYHTPGLQTFDMQKMIAAQPTYVLFNGREGALTGGNALTARVGETVRFYFGVGGPNLASNFHIIGGIFDALWVEGGTLVNHNVQTTMVPPGGSVIADMKVVDPGTFLLVDHALARTFNQGALGMLKVTGPERPELYRSIYSGPARAAKPGAETAAHAHPAAAPAPPPSLTSAGAMAASVSAGFERGAGIFANTCSPCHQSNGQGVPGTFPPLAMSDFLNADPRRAVRIVLHGLQGPIKVNGTGYESVMPPFGAQLSDRDIADVLGYVLNSWGNAGGKPTADDVARIRAGGGAQ